ncbi:MAG TPA: hypothetical protein VER33_21040, partial [Polyangiaceae bacterium]|nr:hypothetical protein [Polyangiaceae bacterium]
MNCSLLTVTHGRRHVLSIVALALLGAGCGADASADLAMAPDGRDPGGATAQPQLTLTFNAAAGLVLAPREERSIEVRISPATVYQVRFSLLDDPTGERRPHDATLAQTLVDTDARGRAEVELTAPSTPNKLLLRAEVNGQSATLPISVGESDRTTIDVLPNYTGRRSISEWRASVHVGSSCAELPAGIASDGDPFARVPYGEPLRIEQVPLASPIAVVVRAGEFASGCSTLLDATDGGFESVRVTVTDRPLQLAETELDVTFGLQPADPVFSAALNEGDRLLHAALVGDATDDVAALLNAMQVEAELTPGRADQ